METSDCPYIVFKSTDRLFTVNSANVMSITEMPPIEFLPQMPIGMRGVFLFRGEATPVLDLRHAIGANSLSTETEAFQDMLESRKQDHIKWTNELKRSVDENVPFTLTTDPHKCAFGKWIDNYHPENHTIAHHLKKIVEPHQLLHKSAVKIEECSKNGSDDILISNLLHDTENKYAATVIKLLDEAKELFQTSFREMALVLSLGNKYCAIAVDEVLSVDELTEAAGKESISSIADSPIISCIKSSERYPGALILELDEAALTSQFGL